MKLGALDTLDVGMKDLTREWIVRVLDLVYVAIAVVSTQIFSVPQTISSILALPLLIIIPYRVGLAVTFLLEKIQVDLHYSSELFDAFLHWCLGVLVILFLSVTLSYVSLFNVTLLLIFVLVLALISVPARTSLTHILVKERLNPFIYLIVSNGFAFVSVLRFYSFPPPFQPAWDTFAEMTIHNLVRYDDFFSLSLLEYSRTFLFNLKSPVFPLVETLVASLLGVDFLALGWVLPFLMMPLFGVFLYVMVVKLTGDRVVAGLAGCFGIWTGDLPRPSPVWPFQSAVAIVMLPLVVSLAWQEYQHKQSNDLTKLAIVFLTFGLFHYILGVFVPLVLLLSLSVFKHINGHRAQSLTIVLSVAIVFLAMLLFQETIPTETIEWDPLYNLTGYKGFNIQPHESYARLLESLTPPLLALSLVAIGQENLKAWLSKPSKKESSLWTVWVFSGLLLILALPIANSHRVFPLVHIFAAFLAALTIGTAIRTAKLSRKSTTIAAVLVVVLMIPFLSTPLMSFIQRAQSKTDVASNIASFSDYELAMADWLSANTPKNTLIISDPTTQLIVEALSRRPSFSGMYMDSRTATLLKQAITTSSDFLSYALLREILRPSDAQQVLLVSGRTAEWAGRDSNEPLYYPLSMKPTHRPYLSKFNQSQFFTILKETQDQIFAIKIHEVDFQKPENLSICSGNETSGWISNVYNISIDSTDYLTGMGAILISGKDVTPGWRPFWYGQNQTWDLTKYNLLSISLKIETSYALNYSQAFSVIIIDAAGRKSWWNHNTSINLTRGIWQEIRLNVPTPDVREGEVDLANISSIRFTSNYREIGNLTCHIDSIKAELSLDPLP